jgi:hypothetical protein
MKSAIFTGLLHVRDRRPAVRACARRFDYFGRLTLHFPKIDPKVEYTRTTIHFDGNFVSEQLPLPAPMDLLSPFKRLRNHVINLSGERKEEAEAMLLRLSRLSAVKDALTYNRFCLQFAEPPLTTRGASPPSRLITGCSIRSSKRCRTVSSSGRCTP